MIKLPCLWISNTLTSILWGNFIIVKNWRQFVLIFTFDWHLFHSFFSWTWSNTGSSIYPMTLTKPKWWQYVISFAFKFNFFLKSNESNVKLIIFIEFWEKLLTVQYWCYFVKQLKGQLLANEMFFSLGLIGRGLME